MNFRTKFEHKFPSCEIMLRNPQRSIFMSQESDLKVRLLGPVHGEYISEGVVQVEREGRWGFICPTQWGYNESRVVCGQLGFPDAAKSQSYRGNIPDRNPTYWMDKVACSGVESSLLSCDHQGWEQHKCEEGHVAKITCSRSISKVNPMICKIWSNSLF